MTLTDLLLKHEGIVLHAYEDSRGFLTIGVGRLIDKRRGGGISRAEALYLLQNDIERKTAHARASFPWFDELGDVRKDVIVSMIFNLGVDGFSKFERTINAIQTENYKLAAKYMLESLWAKQVGYRAQELAKMMETGQYPPE